MIRVHKCLLPNTGISETVNLFINIKLSQIYKQCYSFNDSKSIQNQYFKDMVINSKRLLNLMLFLI